MTIDFMNYNNDPSKMIMVLVLYNNSSDSRGINTTISIVNNNTNYLKIREL